MNTRNPLIVALDYPDPNEARALVRSLAGRVGMFKVGSQLFTAAGPDFIRELVAAGEQVFLDLKYHDIPNTVASAVSAASQLQVSLLDVHALGGRAMMEAAVSALPAMGTRLLGITMLTSHDQSTIEQIGLREGIDASVERLARLAKSAGLDGVVASAREVPLIRASCGPDFLIVTPGIRPAGAEKGDQARAATATVALEAGADFIVVGRPITAAPDPARAAASLLEEIARARRP